jgi:hypothetical protein
MLNFYGFFIGTLRVIRGILVVLVALSLLALMLEVFFPSQTSMKLVIFNLILFTPTIYGLKFFANYLHRQAYGKDSTPPISSFFSF